MIRDDDTAVYGDRGYASDAKKRAAEAAGVLWAVKEKAKPGGRLTARQRGRNHRFGKVRAKVEHVFRIVKCQFGYRKVRYRGIAKNAPLRPLSAAATVTRSIRVALEVPGASPASPFDNVQVKLDRRHLDARMSPAQNLYTYYKATSTRM